MGKIFNRYTVEQRAEFCKEWEASGLSQSQYCREKGINVMTFNSWVKKFLAKKGSKFIPVSVSEEAVNLVSVGTLEIKIPGKIVISLPITAGESLIASVIKTVSKCI